MTVILRRIVNLWLLLLLAATTMLAAATGDLREKLKAIPVIDSVGILESDHFAEKYVVYLRQAVDPKDPSAGTFTQRVILGHIDFNRPTILVTEGYGAAYALKPKYRDELSELLDANMIVVEHRYFSESTPEPLNWDYLTAENSAYDLHQVHELFKPFYSGKWVSTGISKGGQTTMIYRTFFPNDVDFSVPYVGPLCKGVEDGRHEPFLRKVGTKKKRQRIQAFQLEILKRKEAMLPLLESFSEEKKLTYRIPLAEVLDYCVLEYSFAFWQWGTSVCTIPPLTSDDATLFNHLVEVSGPDYFAGNPSTLPFFVQAARELGYYGYDVKPFKKYLTIKSTEGYLNRLMLPEELVDKVKFSPVLYHKIHDFLKENDPKIIFIYGENDPWSAPMPTIFKGKKNEHFFIQPHGSHRSRIHNMPEEMKEEILGLMKAWLAGES